MAGKRPSDRPMNGRWYKNYRLEWIKEMLGIYGFINRKHVMRKFGLSIVQASKDLKDFQEKYPDLIDYSLSEKEFQLNTSGKSNEPSTS